MTENTLLYHFYVSKKLSESEILKVASIGFGCEVSEVTCIFAKSRDQMELATYSAEPMKIFNMRFYPKNLLYVIEFAIMDPKEEMALSHTRDIETKIRDFLRGAGLLICIRSMLVPLKRGDAVWPFVVTGDHRVYAAKLDALLAEEETQFQNVKIYHSPVHGNTLYLDDDVMFGESDQEPYTRVLLGLETGKPKRNNFEGKEILILGGGDGGVINELLKQNPKMVVMCDIDEVVIKLCRKYMRSACEDALDTFEGPNKKIIIGDCLQHLHECIQSGKKYDFIINDLTEFPVNKEERGWMYNFATDNSQVMELSLKALKPDGKYLSRGGTISAEFFWKLFEEDCRKIGCQYKVYPSFVPSFYEVYRLYEVTFSSQQ